MPFQVGFNTTPKEDMAWDRYWQENCKTKNSSKCKKCGLREDCKYKRKGEE